MPEMYARPTWDAAGFDAWIVLQREFRPDLPGMPWIAWVTYGPGMTRVDLGQVAGQLVHAKAEASRRAREQNFVPKGLWRPVEEDA